MFDSMATEIDFQMNFEDSQQSEADKKLFVIFYRGAVHNEPESIKQGRPVFDDRDFIRIMTPGSRDTFVGDATPEYQQRFSQQWMKYKAGRDQTVGSGTPLGSLGWLSPAQIMEFNAVGCHTIEQLVGMPDSVSQKFMGHHQIKQRAQLYLDAAKNAAPVMQLQKALEDSAEALRIAQETNKALEARIAALESENKPKSANKVPHQPQA